MEDRELEVSLLANKFHRMVAKESIRVWSVLPQHTKVWVSLEDVMQDGMLKLVTDVLPNWEKSKSSLSTFATQVVRNHLDDMYTVKYGGRWKQTSSGRRFYRKHNEGSTVGIEDLVPAGERRNCWDVLHSMAANLVYSDVGKECWSVPTLLQIYAHASEPLKKEIIHWFLTNERLRLDTPKFCVACEEFRKLADKYGFDCDDCRHLMNSPVCMDKLSRELTWVPYDLAHPTPALAYA